MKHRFLPGLALMLAVACGGATAVPLETLPRTPAAVGVVEVERDANQNTVGALKVQHLAPPQQLRNDLNVYVAWVRPVGENTWQNVGQLVIGESREGRLEVRVPHSQFELTLSAESDGQAERPSEFVVLRGAVDARDDS